MRIGVITRGKYGERVIETIKKRTDFEIESEDVPEFLPDFIEDPEEFVDELDLNSEIFSSDLVITYSLHPDVTPEIAIRAGKGGAQAVIIPGGLARAGSQPELQKIADRYGIYIEVDEICCTLEKCGIEAIDAFAEKFGQPVFNVELEDGHISKVDVVKGSPCGSTWFMAEELVGKTIEEAPPWAGLLCQQYPCRGVRGGEGGIHASGDLHKYAMEQALGQDTELHLADQSRPIKIRGKDND
ncbi:MAG: DUF166 domain-containing protein [Methanotrichaceae archaeon]